jgi:transcription elongation factor Elf1
MKFRIIVTILTVSIIGLFAMVVYQSNELMEQAEELRDQATELKYQATELSSKNKELKETNEDLEASESQLVTFQSDTNKKLIECLNEGIRNSWEIASNTNTITAYSSFVDNCNEEDEEADCKEDNLEKAIESLLNAEGYVQLIETNGNPLYTQVTLSLKGEYIKFKTNKRVRSGAIGINNCGSSNPAKIGIVLKNKIVKVLDKCNTPGSKSVWGRIQYTN